MVYVVYLSFVVCIFHSGRFSLPRPQKLLGKLIIHPLYIFSRNPTNLSLLIEKNTEHLRDILHSEKSVKIAHGTVQWHTVGQNNQECKETSE